MTVVSLERPLKTKIVELRDGAHWLAGIEIDHINNAAVGGVEAWASLSTDK
jgi:hypothetical protein